MPISAAAFSPDATILVLAHAAVLTLWDVESNALLRVLDGGVVQDMHSVVFVGGDGRYLAAGGSKFGVAVWDLLSCEGELGVVLGMLVTDVLQ